MEKIFQSADVVALGVVGEIAFALGIWGYWDCSFAIDPSDPEDKKLLFSNEACHLKNLWHMGLATLNLVRAGGDFSFTKVSPDPWQLVIAQLALPAIAIVAAIKLVYNKVRRDVHVMLAGREKDHIIICGLGDTAMQIAQNL